MGSRRHVTRVTQNCGANIEKRLRLLLVFLSQSLSAAFAGWLAGWLRSASGIENHLVYLASRRLTEAPVFRIGVGRNLIRGEMYEQDVSFPGIRMPPDEDGSLRIISRYRLARNERSRSANTKTACLLCEQGAAADDEVGINSSADSSLENVTQVYNHYHPTLTRPPARPPAARPPASPFNAVRWPVRECEDSMMNSFLCQDEHMNSELAL